MTAEADDALIPARGPASTKTFAALAAPMYRRFFFGQAISLPGTWMQRIGQTWLIVELTGSGTYLGLLTAAQFLPVLLLAPYGGVIVDRYSKRTLLMITQSVMCASAAGLAMVTLSGHATVPAVLISAVVLGMATALDNPTRQSIVVELVGRDLVRNAVTLNSVLVNGARAVGPALAGVVIVAGGTGWCFAINALSFLAVLVSLISIRIPDAQSRAFVPSGPGQIRDGFRYVATHPEVFWPIVAILIIGTFAWEFPITLPLLTRTTFSDGAQTYGWLTSSMGAGAVLGGLIVARRNTVGLRSMTMAASLFGIAILGLSVAPNAPIAIAVAALVGWGSTAFMSISNATIQLATEDAYRGRVMSLWSLAFAGSTPVGGPIVGWLAEHTSPRWALAVGALACCLAATLSVRAQRRSER